MRIRKQKSFNKKLLIIGAAALVVAGAGLWWLTHRGQLNSDTAANTTTPTNTVNYGPPTQQEKSNQNQQKDNLLNSTTGDGSTPVDQPSSTLSISVTRAGQTGAGQPVNVRTIVNGASSGTCELTFVKGSTSFTKSYPISAAATSSICNADIDISAFADSGSWNLSAVAKSGNSVSSAATWSLTVNK